MSKIAEFLKTTQATLIAIMFIGTILVSTTVYAVNLAITPVREELKTLSQDFYRATIDDIYQDLQEHEELSQDDLILGLMYCYSYEEIFNGNHETTIKCNCLTRYEAER